MTDQQTPETDLNATLINSLLAHVAVIDDTGILLKTNKTWKQFDDKQVQIKRGQVGDNYIAMLQKAVEFGNDYALKILLGLNNILQDNKQTFSLTYPISTDTNSFWFKMTVRPCNDDRTQFMMIHEDISSSMQAKYEREKNED